MPTVCSALLARSQLVKVQVRFWFIPQLILPLKNQPCIQFEVSLWSNEVLKLKKAAYKVSENRCVFSFKFKQCPKDIFSQMQRTPDFVFKLNMPRQREEIIRSPMIKFCFFTLVRIEVRWTLLSRKIEFCFKRKSSFWNPP